MQVAKHKVVAIDYTLSDDDGETIDSSQRDEPLLYLHGEGNIIPGLERVLEGKSVGDQIKVSIAPVDGYGEREEGLRQEVSRDHFDGFEELEVGMQFRAPTDGEEGAEEEFIVVTVVEIGDDTVTVDGNHELAGMTLHFDVTVREVRDATSEEISHGHAHGMGGHEH